MAVNIIVGVSGASGVCMARPLLAALKEAGCTTHLVITGPAKLTWSYESSESLGALTSLADYVYDENDTGARIASGSFITAGMIVIPCSMKTLAGIVTGYADNLLLRAADVCLKENRRLVLVPREMPLGKVHLRNLSAAADLGCAIVPPMLTFYNGAASLDAQVDHVIGKVLMQFGLTYGQFVPWEGILQSAEPSIQ